MLLRGGRPAAPPPLNTHSRSFALPALLRPRHPATAQQRARPRVVSPLVVTPQCPFHRAHGVASDGPSAMDPRPGPPGAGADSGKGQPRLAGQAAAEPPFLPSDEQQRAIDTVLRGGNLFLTGCAGTGKSATLRALQRALQDKHGSKQAYERRVAMVAPTGLAAVLVGGVTLHSLLKLGKLDSLGDLERMATKDELLMMLLDLRTLIVDEAGMVSAELLQMLDHYLSAARQLAAAKGYTSGRGREQIKELLEKPFGGLQIILSGDVFQLKPIDGKKAFELFEDRKRAASEQKTTEMTERPRRVDDEDKMFHNRGYVFQAPVFEYGGFEYVELTQVFRQEDEHFVTHLNNVRCGGDKEFRDSMSYLRARCGSEVDCSDGIKPTHLYATNKQVDGNNKDELNKLPGVELTMTAVEGVKVTFEPPSRAYAPLLEKGLVVRQEYDDLVAELEEVAAQGVTHEEKLSSLRPPKVAKFATLLREKWLEQAEKNLQDLVAGKRGGQGADGRGSSGRSSGGLFDDCQAAKDVPLKVEAQVILVRNMDQDARLVNGSRGVVIGFEAADDGFERECMAMAARGDVDCSNEMRRWLQSNRQIPRVRFRKGKEVLVRPAIYTTTVTGYGVALRVQMPLKLAWALTIHKSQGMTLDKVVVDLQGVYTRGMLYTALSRARGPEGLQVINYCKPKTDPEVMAWAEAMREGGDYNLPATPSWGPVWCWKANRHLIAGVAQNNTAHFWFKGQQQYPQPQLQPQPQPQPHQRQQQHQHQHQRQHQHGDGGGGGPTGSSSTLTHPSASLVPPALVAVDGVRGSESATLFASVFYVEGWLQDLRAGRVRISDLRDLLKDGLAPLVYGIEDQMRREAVQVAAAEAAQVVVAEAAQVVVAEAAQVVVMEAAATKEACSELCPGDTATTRNGKKWDVSSSSSSSNNSNSSSSNSSASGAFSELATGSAALRTSPWTAAGMGRLEWLLREACGARSRLEDLCQRKRPVRKDEMEAVLWSLEPLYDELFEQVVGVPRPRRPRR